MSYSTIGGHFYAIVDGRIDVWNGRQDIGERKGNSVIARSLECFPEKRENHITESKKFKFRFLILQYNRRNNRDIMTVVDLEDDSCLMTDISTGNVYLKSVPVIIDVTDGRFDVAAERLTNEVINCRLRSEGVEEIHLDYYGFASFSKIGIPYVTIDSARWTNYLDVNGEIMLPLNIIAKINELEQN